MGWSQWAGFALAYLAVLVLPGPGVTALVARVLARGTRGVWAFVAGFVAGSLVWFTVAATGLALVAAAFAGVFTAIRYAGAAYLLYLAWKFWRAEPRPIGEGAVEPERAEGGRLFLAGLAINLGNPKVIVFFLALLPTVVDLRGLGALGFVELAGTVAVIAGSVLSAYAVVAGRARRLFATRRAVRLLNRGSGVVIGATAVAIAAR